MENYHIFRAYDIRGTFGVDLTVDTMLNIGKSLGSYLHMQGISKITVGGDIRASTPTLQYSFLAGLSSTGISADLVIVSPLGITLFNSLQKKLGASAFITASHLPPEWNGIKFYWGRGIGFSPEENNQVLEIFKTKNFQVASAFETGSISEVDPFDEYVKYINSKFNFRDKYKIAIDCGNGATSLVVPQLYERLGFEVVPFYCNPDPTFPNRSSEPNEESLQAFSNLVKENQVNFGVGFDGDGDRAVFLSEDGMILSPDVMGLVVAKDMLTTSDGNHIIINMECSLAMENYLREMGAEVFRIRVGHSFLSLEAERNNAIWGVENSGHAIAPDIFLFDDALILPLLVARAVENQGLSLSKLGEEYKLPIKKRHDVKCDDSVKFKVMEKLNDYLRDQTGDISEIDGTSLTTPAGRILVRVSNTSPKIRITVESMDQRDFEVLENTFVAKLKAMISE